MAVFIMVLFGTGIFALSAWAVKETWKEPGIKGFFGQRDKQPE